MGTSPSRHLYWSDLWILADDDFILDEDEEDDQFTFTERKVARKQTGVRLSGLLVHSPNEVPQTTRVPTAGGEKAAGRQSTSGSVRRPTQPVLARSDSSAPAISEPASNVVVRAAAPRDSIQFTIDKDLVMDESLLVNPGMQKTEGSASTPSSDSLKDKPVRIHNANSWSNLAFESRSASSSGPQSPASQTGDIGQPAREPSNETSKLWSHFKNTVQQQKERVWGEFLVISRPLTSMQERERQRLQDKLQAEFGKIELEKKKESESIQLFDFLIPAIG